MLPESEKEKDDDSLDGKQNTRYCRHGMQLQIEQSKASDLHVMRS
jgi:hypothetical protein